MNRSDNSFCFDDFLKLIYKILGYLRCFISITIIIAIVVTMWSVPQQILRCADVESNSLIDFLEYIINIIIAAELIQVLLHQSLGTIVEILTLALTRELILQELSTEEFLIGVLGIAVLFAIRKFLFVKFPENSKHEESNNHSSANIDIAAFRRKIADLLNSLAARLNSNSGSGDSGTVSVNAENSNVKDVQPETCDTDVCNTEPDKTEDFGSSR